MFVSKTGAPGDKLGQSVIGGIFIYLDFLRDIDVVDQVLVVDDNNGVGVLLGRNEGKGLVRQEMFVLLGYFALRVWMSLIVLPKPCLIYECGNEERVMKKGTERCNDDSYTTDGGGYKMRGTGECGMDGGVRMFISQRERPTFALWEVTRNSPPKKAMLHVRACLGWKKMDLCSQESKRGLQDEPDKMMHQIVQLRV